jgi:hypothetical protein
MHLAGEVDQPLRGHVICVPMAHLFLASSRDCSIHLLLALDQVGKLLVVISSEV